MPSLADSLIDVSQIETTTEKLNLNTNTALKPDADLIPVFNSMTRCPLPPISSSPDSLRTFYMGGRIPQHRILPSSVITTGSSGGGSVVTTNTTVVSSSTSTSSGLNLKAQQASITTSILIPNQIFQSTILLAKSFKLLSVTANQVARIQLYGTSIAQFGDSGRLIDSPPPAGTPQDIISDLVLDTPPYAWDYQSRVGSNSDSPQSSVVYITITNVSTASGIITATFMFIPLQS